ncbi:phosphoserine transaminase [Haematomicrobium sanguinis]|uniref:phosphoserine transaminase n=1 Tax=Haematomicrobium sanguinis TaxID=479106 RepID=UPI00047DB712|nr:phosphoserine transaminase [Haematomicrobium sanguinis]
MPDITIPAHLLPRDGRFGSGPSKVRDAQVSAVAAAQPRLLGTSHRQAPVRELVGRVQDGLLDFFQAPSDYEVVLGVGGSTAFWDAATFGLVSQRAAHLSFGEFGSKFAKETSAAPFLEDSVVLSSEPGTRPAFEAVPGADVYAWPHNETSTGVMAPVERVAGVDEGALMVVDATSAAGGVAVDASQTDVYYFAPQKNFASDGGLWLALFSPAALERVARVAKAESRWIPDFLSLKLAVDNSRQRQTYNTPSLTTLVSLADQVTWLNESGGMAFADGRTRDSSSRVYEWAETSDFARPYVEAASDRSQVVCTVDFDDAVDAAAVAKVLRANGIVDVEPYRKLGRNQLRIATFVAIEPEDVSALLASIDYVVGQLQG